MWAAVLLVAAVPPARAVEPADDPTGPATGPTAGPAPAGRLAHAHAPGSPSYSSSRATYSPPAVSLIDRHGDDFALTHELARDEPLMLQFIFTTCPGVCPALSAIFRGTQERLGPEASQVRLLSISIDPEHDTPARLREYAERFGAGPNWRFLTGDLEDVVAVQKAFGAYRANKMRHEPSTFVRISPGEPWLRLDGFLSATELVAEYRQLARQ